MTIPALTYTTSFTSLMPASTATPSTSSTSFNSDMLKRIQAILVDLVKKYLSQTQSQPSTAHNHAAPTPGMIHGVTATTPYLGTIPTNTPYGQLIALPVDKSLDKDGWALVHGNGIINGKPHCNDFTAEKNSLGQQIILNDGTADGAPLLRCDL